MMNAKEIENECYDLAKMLSYETEEETQKDLERRYKIVVMILLPRLFGLVRALFFLLSPLAGFFLALLLKAILMMSQGVAP